MLDDRKKVGIGLVVGGMAFSGLGIILFLNSRLISIGNAMFMCGLCFIVGLQGTLSLFTRRQRLPGTICLALGFLMVLFGRLVIVGLMLEGYGFLKLFGNFIPTALNFAREVPILNKVFEVPAVSQGADYIAGKTRPKYSV
jgi:hypothetical protein